MAGLIVVPNAGLLRHVGFVEDLFALDTPEPAKIVFPSYGNVAKNLNTALRKEADWYWLQSDDHRFRPDLLARLFAHEADVTVPLVVKRSPPYELVIGEEGEATDPLTLRVYPAYRPLEAESIPSEPFPVEIAGSAGMLIRRHVLDAIGYPYFEPTDGLYLNEDITFCQKVRAAGFQILCDPAARLGHISTVPVWPT